MVVFLNHDQIVFPGSVSNDSNLVKSVHQMLPMVKNGQPGSPLERETIYEKGQEGNSSLNVKELDEKAHQFSASEISQSIDEINKEFANFSTSAKKKLEKFRGQITINWTIQKEPSALGESVEFEKVSPTIQIPIEVIDDRHELYRLRKLAKSY